MIRTVGPTLPPTPSLESSAIPGVRPRARAEGAVTIAAATRFAERLSADARAIDALLAAPRGPAASSLRASTRDLLALQARVHRFDRELDLAAKVVEKTVGSVRRALDVQV